jgi:dTDP-4-dehydrorhamnose reductase
MRYQNILVTGASGLLGSALVNRFRAEADVIPLGGHHAAPGTRALDLADPGALAVLEGLRWDALVHCAAFRSPDYCEQHRASARQLNAIVPARLADLARRRGARMIHVSTDYVFLGTQPPYHEDDPCQPVNYYGETKREAECGVAAAYPGAVILRIGALYAAPDVQMGSPLVEEALRALWAPPPVEVDDRIMRYPLFVEDVADVAAFLLGREDIAGVIHCGAPFGVTRLGWARFVAQCLGIGSAGLVPAAHRSAQSALRPVDSRLAVDRLRALGGPLPRGADLVLPGVLAGCGDWIRSLHAKVNAK